METRYEAGLGHQGLDKKRTVLLLRSVVLISTCYLIVFQQAAPTPASLTYIAALILSTVALSLTPRDWFHAPRFSAALLLVDTAVVLVGLYLTVGCFSQDFLIIYFFTIFLTTATQSLAQIAVGAAMISGLYGYWLALSTGQPLGPGDWLRLPFFFIVAVFYAYMTEETKQERWRRQQAERESERLRFLLTLGEAVVARRHHEELLGQVAAMVERSFPDVQCVAPSVTAPANGSGGTVVPVECRGQRYGALVLSARAGEAVVRGAVDFTRVAAAVAATALYAGESVRVTQGLMPLRQELLANLSHELRSPLHVVLGNADILAEELQPYPDPLIRESVQRLRAGALRLVDLVEALLCFAESRVSESTPAAERQDLRQLFTELGTLVSATSVSQAEDLRLRLAAQQT